MVCLVCICLSAAVGYCLCGALAALHIEDRVKDIITAAADSGKPISIDGKDYIICTIEMSEKQGSDTNNGST